MVAIAIDVAVQAILLFCVIVLGAVLTATAVSGASITAILTALQVLVIIGYPTLCETLTRGRSLGKAALGLRVVGTDGSPERFRQALARALTGLVELWMTFGVVALITSLLNPNGRRIGDFLGGTIVVQERAPSRTTGTVPMPDRMVHWAATAELSQIDDKSLAMAQQYVQRYNELVDPARHTMGVQVAMAVARRVTPPPPPNTSPVEFLSAVLAERRRREQTRLTEMTARREDRG
ncbi:RDD family protein [Spiractinospora alimapuensis]|nr:RDD family protein [Spiractinospora alimapuensis]